MQMRLITVGEDTKIYGWLKDLTVYSSNFGELKDSKVKYRVSSLRRKSFLFSQLFLRQTDFTTGKSRCRYDYGQNSTENRRTNL